MAALVMESCDTDEVRQRLPPRWQRGSRAGRKHKRRSTSDRHIEQEWAMQSGSPVSSGRGSGDLDSPFRNLVAPDYDLEPMYVMPSMGTCQTPWPHGSEPPNLLAPAHAQQLQLAAAHVQVQQQLLALGQEIEAIKMMTAYTYSPDNYEPVQCYEESSAKPDHAAWPWHEQIMGA
eukprot:gnl/TRDRNA2_/TRDRNA2_196386_c0_seq1.p1 gnl/TRDRNA2_/TRDRNA2_196386_c0~~gnl/TRDRNA2_/TRDRNA2_196386_c0_seq1.p1  ORF type:complete len:175 (+),score=33.08 gnl/TRDRNA2_/TRDRNA2_196386_c0_seq1:65-589(+)